MWKQLFDEYHKVRQPVRMADLLNVDIVGLLVESYCSQQWWNITEYIYSSTLEYKLEVLVIPFYAILLLHYISETITCSFSDYNFSYLPVQ